MSKVVTLVLGFCIKKVGLDLSLIKKILGQSRKRGHVYSIPSKVSGET